MAVEDEKPTVVDPLVMPSNPLRAVPPPGTAIGQYVVDRVLGIGGMGVVVAARHAHLGETVAIKLMHAKAAKNQVQAERFAREAKQTVRIKSERVVRVLDAGTQADGAPYIVMEYLEGRDLGRVLTEDGPLHPTVCADMMLQVCEAVAAAHALGIVHRDLKPSNFFLTAAADGSPLVKVLDFGISKALAVEGGLESAKLTETQAVFGSPTYMSPEQIRSSTNVDQRSDVWSLGVAMFELLTGKLPFIADNVAGLLASIVADAPFRASMFAPNVPPQMEAVILGCLEKDASTRIQSVGELATALKPFASSSADAAVITGRIERLMKSSVPSMHRSFPPPAAALSSRPSAPAPALDFSKTTGTDLIATGDALRRMRSGSNVLAVVIAAIGGAALVVGAVAVFIFVRSRNASVAPADSVGAVASPPAVASIAPPVPQANPDAVPVAVPSASVAAKPLTKGKPRPGAAKSGTPTTPAPPSPAVAPAPNPDTTGSRY